MSLHDLPDCNLRTGLSVRDLAQQGNCDDEDCISLFLGNLGQGTVMMGIVSACSSVIRVSKETVIMRTGMV